MPIIKIKASWDLKRNDLPKIAQNLADEVQEAVDTMGDDLADLYRQTIWVDTGTARRTVEVRNDGDYGVDVCVGWYLGKGFYVGFHEFGTSKMAARPMVRPGAFQAEPIFAAYMEKAIKRAVGA